VRLLSATATDVMFFTLVLQLDGLCLRDGLRTRLKDVYHASFKVLSPTPPHQRAQRRAAQHGRYAIRSVEQLPVSRAQPLGWWMLGALGGRWRCR
jgi:hypothetical protein